MPLSVVLGFGCKFFLVSGLTYENTVRGNPRWCFLFPWCVINIDMSSYWKFYIQASVLLHLVILCSLGQSMPCASIQVSWNCLWMPKCVTPVPFVGCSCRWSLMMIGILGDSMWLSHAKLKEFSIAILGHCRYSPKYHIHRSLTIVVLMVWQRLYCWSGPPYSA